MDEMDGKREWRLLSSSARATLTALCKRGPLWDGDVPSKVGRDELLRKEMAVKIVLAGNTQGYQAATYWGSRVYRAGVEERHAVEWVG